MLLQLRAYSIRGQLCTRKDLDLPSSRGRFPSSNENAGYFGPDQSCVAVDGQSVKTLFVMRMVGGREGGGSMELKLWEVGAHSLYGTGEFHAEPQKLVGQRCEVKAWLSLVASFWRSARLRRPRARIPARGERLPARGGGSARTLGVMRSGGGVCRHAAQE